MTQKEVIRENLSKKVEFLLIFETFYLLNQ